MENTDPLASLRGAYMAGARRMMDEFRRVVPVGDLVVDRWEKAALLGFGEKASIYDSAIVFGDVVVGAHTWVGPGGILDGAAAPVRIGAWCSISAAVHIYTHDSVGWAVTGGKVPYPAAPVTIGDGCIIGAHSFVTRNIPAGYAAWGTPAVLTGRVIVYEDGTGYHIEPLGGDGSSGEALPPQTPPPGGAAPARG